ncbi:BCE_3a_G0014360.mRNA.1.CDS.1 [Saccharomyces cerevisiae]|nr:BCE_3a_G0014360.mRNA.1.CDS.1 [Saccharomyces cerevisiae]CAI7097387.1 BCE_3a_G0014360.mRNA.1.CDS.1 [Saccharomyces cerevisiae]
MAWDINEKRKKNSDAPSITSCTLAEPAIIYFVFIRISHFFFSLCGQCNSLGRMIFMCAYLPAASSRSVANPALPPQKKKKKKKGNSQNGGG